MPGNLHSLASKARRRGVSVLGVCESCNLCFLFRIAVPWLSTGRFIPTFQQCFLTPETTRDLGDEFVSRKENTVVSVILRLWKATARP